MINDEAIKQAQILQNGATTPSQQESCRWVAIESRVVPSVLDGPEERFFEQRRMMCQDNNTKDLLSADALGCSFPFKLHRLLNAAHAQGLESIVSWTPDGNGFKVHNVEQFVKNILPQFFSKQTKYKSFQRQLNVWEFDRFARGPMKGGYTHPNFRRSDPLLCTRMTRLGGHNRNAESSAGECSRAARSKPSTGTPMTLEACCDFFGDHHPHANDGDGRLFSNHEDSLDDPPTVPQILSLSNLSLAEERLVVPSTSTSKSPKSSTIVNNQSIQEDDSGNIPRLESLIDPICEDDLDAIFS